MKFHAVIFFASAMFVYFLSTSTSPRYEFWGDDSEIFQAVGACWAQGYLPYVDLFENKGALIFLIDALGWTIAPRVGIMLLQIPAMYLSMLFMWRTLGLYLSGKTRLAAMAMTLIYYALYYLDGNRTEEWSMPFLMAAMYLFLRGLKNSQWSPYVGLIDGVGFGACVMLRTTNALPLCCCALLSAIFLLRDGELKLLLKNLLTFCAGVVIMLLPFAVYFAAHGALDAATYGTIILNVAYSAQRENFLLTHLDEFAIYVFLNFMPLYLLIVVSAAELLKNRTRLALSGLICGAAMLLMLFKLSPYPGYCALIVPLIPLFFAVAATFAENFRALWRVEGFSLKRVLCKALIVLIMFYPLTIGYIFAARFAKENSDFIRQFHIKQNAELLRLAEVVATEKNSVMMWGESFPLCHWILLTGIVPRCRFFGNVKAFANIDPNVKREWLETARNKPPHWIIYVTHTAEFTGDYPENWTRHFRQNRDADVERLLHERYNLAGEAEVYQDAFRLYRLKE